MPALARAAAILTIGVACGGTAAAAEVEEFAPVSVPMEAVQVAPRTYYVRGQSGMISTANEGFNSNAGFVVTPQGVVVFDTLGTPALGKRFAQVIEKTTSQPVTKVVVSHYHSDHFYGVQAFAHSGVEILAHERVRDYLATAAPQLRLEERRQSLAQWVNSRSRVVAPTRYVGEETVLRLGGLTFRILHAGPAHTPEDLMMLVEEEGVLFVGDLMMTGRIPYVADADVTAWIQAIDRVLTLNPKIVVGGHGPYSTDAVSDLTTTRDYLVYLKEKLSAAFEEGLGFEEAYKSIDWSRFSHLPAFEAANKGNAYQTYLTVEREALRREKR